MVQKRLFTVLLVWHAKDAVRIAQNFLPVGVCLIAKHWRDLLRSSQSMYLLHR